MKYVIDEDRIESKRDLYLGFIANELAEANRLKRLEIESTFYKEEIMTTPANLVKLQKDLEDKAE